MIAATIDTNVLASGFVNREGVSPPARIASAWRARRFDLYLSEHILVELEVTLSNQYFSQRLTRNQVRDDLVLLRGRARIVPITAHVRGVATHPEDDLILATAVSAGADYLVTGDRQLQRLGVYGAVAIVSPRAFLDVLDQESR